MIKYCTIYGERCSGTNYLQNVINANFDVEFEEYKYGWKHFFGFDDLSDTDDVLFIGIVRNPFKWINSLYIEKHHIPYNLCKSIDNFLNDEFYSTCNYTDKIEDEIELIKDRHIYDTNNRKYKNIFEMRHTKLKFLIDDMPTKVKNYIFIKYEDLLNDFENTLNKIKDKGLKLKENIQYPVNIYYYTKNKDVLFNNTSKPELLNKDLLLDKFIPEYEIKLNYINYKN